MAVNASESFVQHPWVKIVLNTQEHHEDDDDDDDDNPDSHDSHDDAGSWR